MKSKFITLLLVVGICSIHQIYGQRRIDNGGDWSNNGIWQGNNVGDDLSEDVTTRNNLAPVNVDANFQIGNFTFGNGFQLNVLNASTLEVGDDFDNNDNTGIDEPRDLSVPNGGSITVQTGGSIIIYGDLIVNNNLTLSVQGDLIVKGNVVLKNNSNINVTGSIDVNGDFTGGTNTNILVQNGASINVDGNVDIQTGNVNINGTGTFTAGSCDPGTPANICNNVLPIELKSFTASKANNNINLDWVTAKEENFSHFEIERSVDQKNWEQIGLVQGIGESNSDAYYDFTDKNAPFGVISYRLKSIDIDATFEYSPVVTIEVGFEGKLAVSPNPVKDVSNLKIQVPSDFREDLAYVGLFDLSGVKILEVRDFDIHSALQINQRLKSGIYILKVNHNGLEENLRVIVE